MALNLFLSLMFRSLALNLNPHHAPEARRVIVPFLLAILYSYYLGSEDYNLSMADWKVGSHRKWIIITILSYYGIIT